MSGFLLGSIWQGVALRRVASNHRVDRFEID